MARARMIDVDYYRFRRLLRAANDVNGRIEKRDAGRWKSYIAQHNINEVGATAIANTHFDTATPVIIDMGGADDGLYLYSDIEESALCLVMQD